MRAADGIAVMIAQSKQWLPVLNTKARVESRIFSLPNSVARVAGRRPKLEEDYRMSLREMFDGIRWKYFVCKNRIHLRAQKLDEMSNRFLSFPINIIL